MLECRCPGGRQTDGQRAWRPHFFPLPCWPAQGPCAPGLGVRSKGTSLPKEPATSFLHTEAPERSCSRLADLLGQPPRQGATAHRSRCHDPLRASVPPLKGELTGEPPPAGTTVPAHHPEVSRGSPSAKGTLVSRADSRPHRCPAAAMLHHTHTPHPPSRQAPRPVRQEPGRQAGEMAVAAEPAANSQSPPQGHTAVSGTCFRNCQSLSPLYPEGLRLRVFQVPFWPRGLPDVTLASP